MKNKCIKCQQIRKASDERKNKSEDELKGKKWKNFYLIGLPEYWLF